METTSQSNWSDLADMKKQYRHRRCNKFIFPVLLILAGVLFLGFNIGFIPVQYKQLIFSWPMLLIALGIVAFFSRQLFGSLVLICVGLFFLIPILGRVEPSLGVYFQQDFARIYWPAILVIAGLLILFHKVFFPNRFKYWNKHAYYKNRYRRHWRQNRKQDGWLDINNAFGVGEHIVLDPVFKGGEINAAFGQSTLDLRKTTLPDGETVLEVNAAFGYVIIYVPADWNIRLQTNNVFGGFWDERVSIPDVSDDSNVLIIVGSCAFGGGLLKN